VSAVGPLCSVIIPAYNVADYLCEAVDSALAQTYRPCEVVVVDDGSTDATSELLARYGEAIVTVRQENRGLAGARNTGVRIARGEMIGLLDADDVWEPQRLARCMEILTARPEVGIVTTDAYLLRERERTSARFYGDYNLPDFPEPGEQLDEIARRNFLWVSAVFRRSLLDDAGMFDERLRRSEDYDFWIRCLLHGARAALVREPLGWYRRRGDSLSADGVAQGSAHLTVLEWRLPELWRRGARAEGGVYFEIARRAAQDRRMRTALAFALMGARTTDRSRRRRARAVASVLRGRAS
jgi:glycosyltransferase involved in cell wall biosynthesis